MEAITKEEFQAYLDEIIDCEAFEIHRSSNRDGTQSFYIPYMMNDALECYLMLSNGRMTGEYRADLNSMISAEFLETEEGSAIIFRQGMENIFTVWYEECFRGLECYRYDSIGHFWVEGEEHWRRLVYIVGTIHDKFNYMGETVCNEKEIALMPLMEFAPFRYFSPIHESLDQYYNEGRQGIIAMKAFAEEAGDKEFLRLIRLYEISPFRSKMVKQLADAMQSPNRNRLYELIYEKIREASMVYPERVYPDGLNIEMDVQRKDVQEKILSMGFRGTYPLFYKNSSNAKIQILAMEEHPFTIMESEHFEFKIQFMISEINTKEKANDINKKDILLRNAGFFKAEGRSGRIAKNIDELDGWN